MKDFIELTIVHSSKGFPNTRAFVRVSQIECFGEAPEEMQAKLGAKSFIDFGGDSPMNRIFVFEDLAQLCELLRDRK